MKIFAAIPIKMTDVICENSNELIAMQKENYKHHKLCLALLLMNAIEIYKNMIIIIKSWINSGRPLNDTRFHSDR